MNTEIYTFTDLLIGIKNNDEGIHFIKGDSLQHFESYSKLFEKACKMLRYLQDNGLKPGDELILVIGDPQSFLISFWACILGGVIAVPVSAGRSKEQNSKLKNIWNLLSHPSLLVKEEDLQIIMRSLGNDDFSKILSGAICFEPYEHVPDDAQIHVSKPNDIFYIQFSSGSTNLPKGITLTHNNVLTNCRAILREIKHPKEGDLFFSWMPLTHDMGLIGYHLTPLLAGWTHYIMPTELFIRRPTLWLQTISKHKITFTASPNFGYRYVLNYVKDEDLRDIDLSSLRIITNGAEPISASLCDSFSNKMLKYGLRDNVIFPVYGLAEASLAVTFSNPLEPVISMRVFRDSLGRGQRVKETESDVNSVSIVNLGRPLIENCQVRIMLDNSIPAKNKVVGRIQIKGENVTTGYYNNTDATKQAIIDDNWLDTGDLGFMHRGCLYVTGRDKDIIFVNGQNFYPHDIEQVIGNYPGIKYGKVAVGGFFNHKKEKEDILVFIDFRGTLESFDNLFEGVKFYINDHLGFDPDYVIPVRDIPRTTSGKIQRYKLVQQYIEGKFDTEIGLLSKSKNIYQVENGNLNGIENQLLGIWRDILDIQHIEIDKSFFALGGNSLKAGLMLTKVKEKFNKDVSFRELFENPSINHLAGFLPNAKTVKTTEINSSNEKDCHSLSSAQLRLYYLWEKDNSSIAYNLPVAFHINSDVNKDKLTESFKFLIERHEVLRASVNLIDNEPKLKIKKKPHFELEEHRIDFSNLSNFLSKSVVKFNLQKDLLFRAKLLNVSGFGKVLFMDFHHIISDGISISILCDELTRHYEENTLEDVVTRFVDYTSWERSNEKLHTFKDHELFWQNHLNGELPLLSLPTDYRRPKLLQYEGAKLSFTFDDGIFKKVTLFAFERSLTPFMVFLSAYYVALSKYCSQEDIIVGVPVSGRNQPGLQHVFGMFVNNIALRALPEGNKTTNMFLDEIREVTLEAYNYQDYPFQLITEGIVNRNDPSRNAVFDTMFLYQNMDEKKVSGTNINLKRLPFDSKSSKYDITLEIFENKNEFHIEYSTTLFNEATIETFAHYYKDILNQMLMNPSIKLAEISSLLKPNLTLNDTDISVSDEYPKEIPIHVLIEKQCAKSGHEIAIIDGQKTVTYQELNTRADQIASVLRKKGVANNEPVGIIMDRSYQMIISTLAILKAGGCFIPIDPIIPFNRISHMLDDSRVKIIISENELLTEEENWNTEITVLTFKSLQNQLDKDDTVSNVNTSTDTSYIIYTSGTTGTPKGTIVSHRSLVNYVWWANKVYLKGGNGDFPFYSSISFDLTITSLFVPLVTGNKIYVYRDTDRMMPLEMVLRENKVDIIKMTPSHLRFLKNSRWFKHEEQKINKIIVGGENLTVSLAKDISDIFLNGVTIYNEYGPTEATIGCMCYQYNIELDKGYSVPIGLPISNAEIYLLDKYMREVPLGAKGELYIGGDCLAHGYINNSDLTNAKFVSNPFRTDRLIYKTGDLAKQLQNGNFEYLGREDSQVKVNGYRIELSEIEEQIRNYSNYCDAVVTLYESDDTTQICAYLVLEEEIQDNSELIENLILELKNHLFKYLPDYMIPTIFTIIQEIPLTSNGKINYQLLPEPIHQNTNSIAARNDLEEKVLGVWKDVLKVDNIGINEVFFEMGGDSIKAVQISSRLDAIGIGVAVKDILTYPTVEQLCYHVEISNPLIKYDQSIIYGDRKLTPIESWFFGQEFQNPHYFNQSVLLSFKREINLEYLRDSLQVIITHHDGLRLNYDVENRTLFYNEDHLDKVSQIDEFTVKHEEHFVEVCSTIKNSFDITKDLLLKMAIITNEKGEETLLLTAHHLVIDGISWRIILEDFYDIYLALESGNRPHLMDKTASQLEWSVHLQQLNQSISDKERKYWEEFESKRGKIPIKQGSNSNEQYASGILELEFTEYLLKGANEIYRTNSLVLLLSALALSLKNWINEDHVVIDLESHGRNSPNINISRTIGWFTAVYPILLQTNGEDLNLLIKSVKEAINSVPNNGIGYGLVKYLDNQSVSKGENFDIKFNYMGQFDTEVENDLFVIDQRKSGEDIDPINHKACAIEINAIGIGGKLNIDFITDIRYVDAVDFKDVYFKNLLTILEYTRAQKEVQFTPSDFDTCELDEEDIKTLFES